MDKQKADQIITEYFQKIYGFAMQKSFSYDEAQELCAEIVAEVYISLLKADEIYNLDGYVYRICAYQYARYVSMVKKNEGISIDEVIVSYEEDFGAEDAEEELVKLRREIAYLTKERREIVYAFYYENKSLSQIAKERGIPEGTVKWHLNKSRNHLKERFNMERKIGKLGIHPIEAVVIGHSGSLSASNDAPEHYLADKLNLNIVYSVYYEPKTLAGISEELGMTPVFIEDRVAFLEENGFLVKQKGDRYTTYVLFYPETFSAEFDEKVLEKKLEAAELLAETYVPAVRMALQSLKDVYIPGGNRELLEAAALQYAISERCAISSGVDVSKYDIRTTEGSRYIALVDILSKATDPEYEVSAKIKNLPSYQVCGSMRRYSQKYPVSSWSIDSRYDTRTGAWANNQTSDYEFVYEYISGLLPEENSACSEKLARLRERRFLAEDGKINIMIVKGDMETFFDRIPPAPESVMKKITEDALETASFYAKQYPPQMHDLVIARELQNYVGNVVALMVKDLLYQNGTFRPLTETERITSDLIMFSDVLPET